nr:MAG TPA: hypothetical protein [Caudoviricetes sp.]
MKKNSVKVWWFEMFALLLQCSKLTVRLLSSHTPHG